LHKKENHDVSIFLDSNGVRFGDWRSSIDSQKGRILVSKKHFIALANLIKDQNDFPNTPSDDKFSEYQIMVLANFCASQN